MIEKDVEILKIETGFLDAEEKICGLCVNYGQFLKDVYKVMDSEILQHLLGYSGSLEGYFSNNVLELLTKLLEKKCELSDQFCMRLGEAVCDFELSSPANQDSDLSKEEREILGDVDVIIRYLRVRV